MKFRLFKNRKARDENFSRLKKIVEKLEEYEDSKRVVEEYYSLLIEGANIIKSGDVDEKYKSFIASRMINFLILSNSNVPDSLKEDLNDEIEYYRKMVKK